MEEIIIVTSLVVILPLIPAFILFKFLPSTGDVSGPFKGLKIKLTGSFAGYFLILLIVLGLITQLDRGPEYEFWQVEGSVELGQERNISDVTIRVHPPLSNMFPDGRFFIQGVQVPKRGGMQKPILVIQKNGYEPATIHLDDRKPVIGREDYGIKYEKMLQKIDVGKPIVLNKARPYSPAAGVEPKPVN